MQWPPSTSAIWSAITQIDCNRDLVAGGLAHLSDKDVCAGHDTFVPSACENVQSFLAANVAGQELALQQFGDAVCDHLQNAQSKSPLVISCHGPPGVGKSLTHLMAATALYNTAPRLGMRCPGTDCPGYKVTLLLTIRPAAQIPSVWAMARARANNTHIPMMLLSFRSLGSLGAGQAGPVDAPQEPGPECRSRTAWTPHLIRQQAGISTHTPAEDRAAVAGHVHSPTGAACRAQGLYGLDFTVEQSHAFTCSQRPCCCCWPCAQPHRSGVQSAGPVRRSCTA